jgi:hypothetical protein
LEREPGGEFLARRRACDLLYRGGFNPYESKQARIHQIIFRVRGRIYAAEHKSIQGRHLPILETSDGVILLVSNNEMVRPSLF